MRVHQLISILNEYLVLQSTALHYMVISIDGKIIYFGIDSNEATCQ